MVTELDPNVMRLNQVAPAFQQGMTYGANFVDQAQEAQRQNAYQNLLRQPGAVDEQGNITPQAMRGMAPLVSPSIYTQIQAAQRLQQQQQLEVALTKAQMVSEAAAGVMTTYQELRGQQPNPVPESVAIQTMQPIYDAAIDRLSSSGVFTPAEISQMNQRRKFNPTVVQATAAQSSAYRNMLEQTKLREEQMRQTAFLRQQTIDEKVRADRAAEENRQLARQQLGEYHTASLEARRQAREDRTAAAKQAAEARAEHQREVAENQRQRFVETEIDKAGTAAGRSWDAQMNAGLLQTPATTPAISRDQWVEQEKTATRFQLQNNVDILYARAEAKRRIDQAQAVGRSDLVEKVKQIFEQQTGKPYDGFHLPMKPMQQNVQQTESQ
jgi:hypothetical protein